MRENINLYLKHLGEARIFGEKVAKTIVEALRQIIPDLEWSLGWAEAGIDTICFYSSSRDISKIGLKEVEKYVRLEVVIVEVFPELEFHIDTPYGVYLKKNEVEKAKKLLEEIR